MDDESIVVFFFLIVFGFAAFKSFLEYRKTMYLAQHGLVEPQRATGSGLLVWGLIIAFVGVALCLGLLSIGWGLDEGSGYPFRLGPWMLGGFIPLAVGLAMLLAHQLTKEDRDAAGRNRWRDVPPQNGLRRSADEAVALDLPGAAHPTAPSAGGQAEAPPVP